jgi:molybdenum cofactor synthesis domain-containing protein
VTTSPDHAIILTVGDEITSGDVANTNGTWLAQRLAAIGLTVLMLAAVRDDVGEIADAVRAARERCALLVVTGGLGGTPDDVTREAVAEAFGVPLELHRGAADLLHGRFPDRTHAYVDRFAQLPAGALPVTNPLGGAPGFRLGNVLVLAGVPAEMMATFEACEEALEAEHGCPPIRSVRLAYSTTESDIVDVLERASSGHPGVSVGSYPHYEDGHKRVEIVLKSSDPGALEAARTWLESAVGEALATR